MELKRKWKRAALSIKTMLENFAVIGAGIAAYEQKIWRALMIGLLSAIFAIAIAMVAPDD